MNINIQRNREYYNGSDLEVCTCPACVSYCRYIKNVHPELAEYLKKIGVDILKPFELIWMEDADSKAIDYWGCQYIVFGECEDDFVEYVAGHKLEKSICHPSTNIEEKHFVLEFGDIRLKNVE